LKEEGRFKMTSRENIAGRPLFLMLLLTLLIAVSGQAAENLLNNPGFEYGNTQGWTDWGCDLRAASDQVHSGNYSVLAYNRTQSWQGPLQSILGVAEDGKTYRISGWVRLQNADDDWIGITVSQTDSDGTHYHRVNRSTGYNDRWIQLYGNFTLNVTGNLTELNVYFEGPEPGVNFYLDDAEVLLIRPPAPNAIGSVDVSTVYQELEGFGASGAWYEGWLTAHPLKNQLYDILFGQLGLDIYRLRNTYDISTSYIADSAQIVQAAEASLGHPIKIMISSWSPPPYLKSNGSIGGGTLKKDSIGNYKYDEFAEWWADSLATFSSYGINADYINIQNEPNWVTDYDTCLLDPSESATVAGYNEAFEAVWQKLNNEMGSAMPKMLAAEVRNISLSGNYLDNIINDSHVYGYSHHLYGDGSGNNPDAYIPAMTNFASQYGDKPRFQTEYSHDETTFTDAINLAMLMHNSLTIEGVSVYMYWSLFWDEPSGLVALEFPWGSDPGYTINPVYYAFKQYSAFTDPGWRRVEASTDSSGLRISAFISPDANELTIIIINTSDTGIDLSLSLGYFSPESCEVYRTSETEHTAYVGIFDQSQPLTLPPQTITTVSLTGSYSPPLIETFEQGNFNSFNWRLAGDADWFVTSDQANTGSYSARAGDIEDDEISTLTLELDCVSGDISFYRKVSSESNYDHLRFYIDGVEKGKWSGQKDWEQVSFHVTAGRRTFEWTYSKDGSVSSGDDTAWIDDIVFPR